MFVNAKNNKHGVISGTFLLAYGVIRFLLNTLGSLILTWVFVALQLSMGQLLSIPMAISWAPYLMKS